VEEEILHEGSMPGTVIYISEFQNNWPGNSAYLYHQIITSALYIPSGSNKSLRVSSEPCD
jgi:hypothetical protein